MSKVVGAVLPIAGAVLGNLVVPGLGAAIGGALGGIGSGALSGGGWQSMLEGGALGGIGGYFGVGGGLGGATGVGTNSIFNGVQDPIEAISKAMDVTGTSTATEAANALGFSSTNGMLASVNPGWLTTGAAISGRLSNAVAGIGGGTKPALGSFTGTAGSSTAPGVLAGRTGILGRLAGNTASHLGPLSSLLSIGSGIYGMGQAAQLQKLSQQLAQSGGQYSPEYAAQLNALMKNPGSITSMPGYEAGMTAVERSMAAQGYQGSGNMAAALQQYGGNFFNQQVAQLQGLAQGGAATTQAALAGEQAGNSAASQALQAMGYGVAGLGY